MLHVNCHMKMRWETDILQLRSNVILPPPGFKTAAQIESDSIMKPTSSGQSYANVLQPTSGNSKSEQNNFETPSSLDLEDLSVSNESSSPFEALTIDEGWTDDAELLRSVVKMGSIRSTVTEGRQGTMKSIISSKLLEVNPARFPDRSSVQQFLARAVDTSIVVETREGSNQLLHLPLEVDANNNTYRPSISLSVSPPFGVKLLTKTIAWTTRLPFILFAPKGCAPSQDLFPPNTFIQNSACKKWFILMFSTLTSAQRAVVKKSWLRSCVLVDWRRASELSPYLTHMVALPGDGVVETKKCIVCGSMHPKTDTCRAGADGTTIYCSTCFMTEEPWTKNEKAIAISTVLEIMEMMATNDDFYVADGVLKKILLLRCPSKLSSKKHANFWIEETLKKGLMNEFKREESKSKQLCLPKFYEVATAPVQNIVTGVEEEHVLDLLWSNKGWMPKTEVIASLTDKFDRMKTHQARMTMFRNAREREKFFVAKGPYGQTVGLTYEDANAALKLISVPLKNEETHNHLEPKSNVEVETNSSDGETQTVSGMYRVYMEHKTLSRETNEDKVCEE